MSWELRNQQTTYCDPEPITTKLWESGPDRRVTVEVGIDEIGIDLTDVPILVGQLLDIVIEGAAP